MKLDEFLGAEWPHNAHVKHPDFSTLYLRKGIIGIALDDKVYRCSKVVTIGDITSKKPGHGAFARLVEDLVQKGWAVFVENVHNERFRPRLESMGFIRVNDHQGFHYLFNHDGHLEEWVI